jgi:hypothetical protein
MERPLEGVKAALAVPSYGPTDSLCAKDIRVALMNASAAGLTWVGDVSPDRMGFAPARNTICQALIGQGPDFADGVAWIDNDMRMKRWAITRLINQAKRYSIDFISGVYHKRGNEYEPVFFMFDEKEGKYYTLADYPENTIAPADACGFGFVWTSFKMIDAMARHPDFDPKCGWFRKEGLSEDIAFCDLARRAGIQLYVDTGIQLGHMGEPEIITREHFLKAQAEKKAGEKDGEALARSPEAEGGWGL